MVQNLSFKTLVNRIEDAHGPIDLVKRADKARFSLICNRFLVRDPACVYSCHIDATLSVVSPSRPCHHIEGCLRHVSVWMCSFFTFPIEDPFHGRYIYDKAGIL